jgi:Cof subfamily protein (haloacid dehalogenase superfamily)
MTYRLLALDLDGTLLDRDGKVAARDRTAIAALRDRGVIVTIITGRLAAGALEAAQACDIQGLIGCCDGSHLYEVATNHTAVHHALPDEASRVLDDILRDEPLTRYVFSTDRVFCDTAGHRYAGYVKTWAPHLSEISDLTTAAPEWNDYAALAQLVIGDPDTIATALAEVNHRATELRAVHFAVSFAPDTHAMLVRARGPSKGTALTELCAHYGVAVEDSVAVGDWMNDIPMFEVAGRSFSMPVASPEVKAAASDHLGEDNGSIADAIAICWPTPRARLG